VRDGEAAEEAGVLTIDGAYGEGGGQILRTSLATGILFRIERGSYWIPGS